MLLKYCQLQQVRLKLGLWKEIQAQDWSPGNGNKERKEDGGDGKIKAW